MKQIFKLSILVLVLICANAPMAEARVKKSSLKTTSSRSGLSLARTIVSISGDTDYPQNIKRMTGMSRIYYKKVPASRANNMEEEVHYIYGQNVRVTSVGKNNIIVKATGPNAFYYEVSEFYNAQEEYGGTTWTYYFSSKTDRDKFWNEFNADEPLAEKGHKNGWYWVSDFGD